MKENKGDESLPSLSHSQPDSSDRASSYEYQIPGIHTGKEGRSSFNEFIDYLSNNSHIRYNQTNTIGVKKMIIKL